MSTHMTFGSADIKLDDSDEKSGEINGPNEQDVIHIDNGEEYTLIPLDDETFQVFRTSDLIQRQSQSKVETRDKISLAVEKDENQTSNEETEMSPSLTCPSSSDAISESNRKLQATVRLGSSPILDSAEDVKTTLSEPAHLKRFFDPGTCISPKKKKALRENCGNAVVFACKTCDATFSNEFSLDAHIQQHLIWNKKPSDGDAAVAPLTKDGNDSKANLIVLEGEYDSIAGRGLFQCGICGKSFRNVGYIHIHLEKCHDVASDQRVIKRHDEYNKHSQDLVLEDQKGVPGGGGGRVASMSHKSNPSTTSDVKYECDKCRQSFTQHDQLLAHKWLHFQMFKCMFCEKTYTAKKSLQNHAITAHSKYKTNMAYAHIFSGGKAP